MSAVQLSNLPNEVLSKIANYLSLKECVKLERVNSVWRGVMLMQWKRKSSFHAGGFFNSFREAIRNRNYKQAILKHTYKQYKYRQPASKNQEREIEEPLSAWLHSLCKKICPHIKKINIDHQDDLAEDFLSGIISVGAPNLSSLELIRFDPDRIDRVRKLQGISHLSLYNGHYFTERIDAKSLPHIKRLFDGLTNLKHLRFESDYDDLYNYPVSVNLMGPIVSYIPSRLQSLHLYFMGDHQNDEGLFAFENLRSENLKVLELVYYEYGCPRDLCLSNRFSLDARNVPNLTELHIVGVKEVRHLETLKHLEKLSFTNLADNYNQYSSWLETITGNDCEFRSSLLELSLIWQGERTFNPDGSERSLFQDVPLSKFSLLTSLRSLAFTGLPSTEADRVFGLRCIGEACSQLNTLKIIYAHLGDAELAVVANYFPKLTSFSRCLRHHYDYITKISLDVLQRFVNLIPSDRKMKIVFERQPSTDEVEEAGILTHCPNIDYGN